jgi:hypothetical protein
VQSQCDRTSHLRLTCADGSPFPQSTAASLLSLFRDYAPIDTNMLSNPTTQHLMELRGRVRAGAGAKYCTQSPLSNLPLLSPRIPAAHKLSATLSTATPGTCMVAAELTSQRAAWLVCRTQTMLLWKRRMRLPCKPSPAQAEGVCHAHCLGCLPIESQEVLRCFNLIPCRDSVEC